jgi:hypothetical protein
MGRVPKIIFVLGLVLLILGIILVVTSPSLIKVAWEPSSISVERTLGILARLKEEAKSVSLVDQVISVVPAYWEFLNTWSETFSSYPAFLPLILGDAKNIVINGAAVEQHSPPRVFNFYVFNSSNFEIWKNGLASEAYYKGSGASSYSFTRAFNSKEELSPFFFVVEIPKSELNPEASSEALSRVVKVSATISYVEVTERLGFEYTSYYLWPAPLLSLNISEVRNTILEGNVRESSGNSFNFYVFDDDNFKNFDTGKPYSAYYERKGITEDSFIFPFSENQAKSNIYFVVEDTSDYNETVVLRARISFERKVVDYSASAGAFLLGSFLAVIGFITVMVAGIAALVFKPKPKPEGWTVSVTAKGTGSTDTMITSAMINGVPCDLNGAWTSTSKILKVNDSTAFSLSRGVSLPVGGTAVFTIDLRSGDKIGSTTLKSGTTLNIVLRTAGGEDIPTSVTLP